MLQIRINNIRQKSLAVCVVNNIIVVLHAWMKSIDSKVTRIRILILVIAIVFHVEAVLIVFLVKVHASFGLFIAYHESLIVRVFVVGRHIMS